MEARLLELEIEGFRSFRKRVKFTFPFDDSVVLIAGRWKDSPVRSGSGKTSILEALAFLLDISSAAATNLKNWDSKKMFVRGKFKVGESTLEAIRDPKLSLIIDGVPYEGLTISAKDKLRKMLGGNEEIIKSITYRKQRKPGKIINATDSQIKEFLTDPLNLREVEAAADQFTQQANRLVSSLELLKRDEANLAQTLHMNLVTEEESTRARAEYDSAKLKYEQMSTGSADVQLKAQADRLIAEINSAHQVVMQVNLKTNENASIKNQVVQIQGEIAHLEKSACPTCKREWDQAQELLKQKNASIDSLVLTLRTNVEYINNSAPIVANVNTLQAQLREVQQKIGELSAPLQMAWQALDSATRMMNMLQNKHVNYMKMSGQLESVRSNIAAQSKELEILEMSAKMLGRTGFLGCIFDEILSDIEVRTNDMLQSFPNASQFTVQVGSTKLVKTKGTTKKEISVTVSRGGMDLNFEDDLSGGQKSAIELCTDLAYAEAVRSRSGCSLRWTCLDEVMDGLGPAEKEAVVDMIRRRIKGLVLMVEHATEIRESFDQVINIEYDGRESYVTA